MNKELPPTRDGIAEARTEERDLGQTIVPPPSEELVLGTTIDRGLELFDTIGEGGMGLVRRGEQRALGREVAVKGLKPSHRDARAAGKLLREARVTGGLEHPNVIPVYEIAVEEDGSPLIVLKKVEGVEWAALLKDAAAVRHRFGTDDLFEWNVRVLIQVCNVIAFAHDRRVLHRDLKPSNVMIGRFGEVYVLDWGIAVTLADAPGALLPRASEATALAGTPVYMAPEMLAGEASLLSERTDVYLLGAVLYEIVSGHPPHPYATLSEIVRSIYDDVAIPPGTPAELASILERALDRDPPKRFESATALKLALEEYLRHRSSNELGKKAAERLVVLLDSIAKGEDRDAIYRLYGECRFGLRHALEAWPDNAEVQRSLERAAVSMVELELARGEPKAARVLLSDLDRVPPELEARVAERERAVADEYAELRRLRADHDPARGRSVRRITFAFLALLWVTYPLGVELARVTRHWTYSIEAGIVATAAVLAGVSFVAWWYRTEVLATAINRRLAFAVVLAPTTQLAQAIYTWATGGSILGGIHDRLLSAAAIVAMLAASAHWAILIAAGGYLVAYLSVLAIGLERVLWATSAANLVLFVNLYAVLARTPRT